jgi:CBS domain-containing protein
MSSEESSRTEENNDLIEGYMNNRMTTIGSKNSVLDAVKIMAEKSISSLAVTDERNRITGILTERDIVKIIANEVSPEGITIGSLMSTPPVSINRNASVEEGAQLMLRKRMRHLLVEDPDSHEIIGIITTTDLARYLKQKLPIREEDSESSILKALYASEEEEERLFWR